MKKEKVLHFAQSAIISAMYVALTYAQEMIIPASTSMAVQFRMSEALMMLCTFSPTAIYGLTLGCVISNLINVSVLPLDVILGSFATFMAAVCMYRTRNIRFKNLPVLSALMPAVFNGVIIGMEIELFYIEGSFKFTGFLVQGCCVALGEILVLYTLGLILYKVMVKRGLDKLMAVKSNKV